MPLLSPCLKALIMLFCNQAMCHNFWFNHTFPLFASFKVCQLQDNLFLDYCLYFVVVLMEAIFRFF